MRAALPLAALAALAFAAPASASSSDALDRAADALGGEEAVAALDGFSHTASGESFIFNEGFEPGGAPGQAALFTAAVTYRAEGRDAVRVVSQRNSRGRPRPVTEVVDGRRGTISGQYGNFGAPLDRAPMTSDRVAAILREQLLLNPQLLVREALARRRDARGDDDVLVLRDDVAQLRLELDEATGLPAVLTTREHDYQRREVDVRVVYDDWQDAGGVMLPASVTKEIDGFVVSTETRSGLVANPDIAEDTFDAGTADQPFDRELAARGERTSHWLNAFAHLGFPKDGAYDLIQPRELAPGIVLLDGVSNYTLVIERAGGVVVVDGSVHDLRAEHVIDYIQATFPGKPVTHVVSLHHHADHNAGVRPYVALGARLVTAQQAAAFWTGVLADRDARILPDRLDRSDEPATVDAVGQEGLLLPDADRPVSVYPEPTGHAADTAFVHVPDAGLLMVNGDTYGPGNPPGAGGAALQQQILLRGLDVDQIAGAHGRPVTYAEFLAGLGG